MSDSLLSRWSRRKAEAAAAEPEAAPEPIVEAPTAALQPLPDVATLDAGSDYAPFLGAEVPAELRRAALRKLWSEPAFAAAEVMDVHAVGLPGPTFGGAVATLFRVGEGMAEMLAEEPAEAAKDEGGDQG